MSVEDFNSVVNTKGKLHKGRYSDIKKTFFQNIIDLDKAGHVFTTAQFRECLIYILMTFLVFTF